MVVEIVICPVCKTKMKDVKRKGGFHKQTKYKCPNCGLVKMKKNTSR